MLNATRRGLGLAQGWKGWEVTACLVFAAIIAVAMLARDAFAQEAAAFDLHGVVVDGVSGQAVPGAFVGITGTEWGSLTNGEGRFLIPDLDPGPISLTVEALGYEALTWDGSVEAGDAPVLSLEPKALLLEGLQVVTDRFESRRRATPVPVRAFHQADLTSAPQRTILEFVAARMGISQVRCRYTTRNPTGVCLRVRGRSEPVNVWVDEAPVIAGLDYLDHMPPHELYMVEVYNNGRHIRAYTNQFMEWAAKTRLHPIPIF